MGRRRVVERCAEYELVFGATGSVQLIAINRPTPHVEWSSDDDINFAEEFDGDFFDANDEDEICEYLEEQGIIEADTVIDIVEEDAGDDDPDADDDDGEDIILEGEFIESRKKRL